MLAVGTTAPRAVANHLGALTGTFVLNHQGDAA
jgi:hypothetical protein